MTEPTHLVRPCGPRDLDEINEIYNHFVRSTHVTFDIDDRDAAWRRSWLTEHATERHRVFVAVREERLLGYCTSGPYRPRAAYETSVETSVYVRPEAVGTGVGTALYRALFAALDRCDVHRAVAGIALPNDASIVLHRAFGFRFVGRFTEQGRKFGRYWDVAWYERPCPAPEATPA
ncbi:MAG: N-acetyltransferase family protein [Actinomycetota bacterium]